MVANATKSAADLLAKTTLQSAEVLAEITRTSAEQLRKSNEISTKLLNRLTIVLVAVGLIQIVFAAIGVLNR